MQSDVRNNIMERVNDKNVKKKKKKKTEAPDNVKHELAESRKVQTEKHPENGHKKKKNKELENVSLQTSTDKKKKRKLNEEVEVVTGNVMNKVKKKTHTAESQEPQKPAKKKRATVTQEDCRDIAQEEEPVRITEREEEPALLIGTRKRKRRQTLSDEPQVDPNLLNELKEFFPKIESKSSHAINKMIMYDLPRFKEFRKQGIKLRHGRFSHAENERLRQNVRDFIALTGGKNAAKLFHPNRLPEERRELTKMKKDYKFFERIAEGIPRPCHDIFVRGRKVFDGTNYKGRFEEEEIRSLLKYHSLHGSNWQKISELMGRSPYALEKRFNQFNKDRKSGPWSAKEKQRLLRAVRDHVVTVLKSKSPNKTTPKIVSKEILYQKLPWSNISLKVKTRCWSKCREKWMSILAVRMSSGTCREKKAQEAKIRLIKLMYELQVEDVADINWEDLTAVFGDVPPAYVQSKWHRLKVSYVPDWKSKCFGDIIDFLYERILPRLVKDCEDLDDDELKVDQKQTFLLADIFQDINEDHCSDSEEESGQKEDDKSS